MDNILPSLISGIVVALISAFATYKMIKKSLKQQDKILKITEENKFRLAEFEKEIRESITQTVEKNKFRLAAIDKRLEVAQEAYILWEEMRSVMHSEFHEKIKIVNKCQEWWFKNCLYLSPKVRIEFFKIIRRLQFYDTFKDVAKDTKNSEELDKIFNEINDLGSVIEESVDLEKLDYNAPQQN